MEIEIDTVVLDFMDVLATTLIFTEAFEEAADENAEPAAAEETLAPCNGNVDPTRHSSENTKHFIASVE